MCVIYKFMCEVSLVFILVIKVIIKESMFAIGQLSRLLGKSQTVRGTL